MLVERSPVHRMRRGCSWSVLVEFGQNISCGWIRDVEAPFENVLRDFKQDGAMKSVRGGKLAAFAFMPKSD